MAQEIYVIDSKQSNLQCSIKYSLIGRYNAVFENFSGDIDFNSKNFKKSKISFRVKTNSIKSHFPALDQFVRSKRLLDATHFSEMTFVSKSLNVKDNRGSVEGVFDLHGVKKELSFPFLIKGPFRNSQGKDYLVAGGTWRINRKDFNVTWNKMLDHGGIIVGDTVTIRWKMVAIKKSTP